MVQYRRLDFFSAIRQHERLHIYNAHLQADIISSQHKTSKETHFQQICAKIYWSIILISSNTKITTIWQAFNDEIKGNGKLETQLKIAVTHAVQFNQCDVSPSLSISFQELNEFSSSKEVSNVEFKEIRSELREYKHRETRLLTDYAELEEENITLQKQISNLRSSQVRKS